MILFRIACLLQVLLGTYFCFETAIGLATNFSGSAFVRLLIFLIVTAIPIFGFSLYSRNYPDQPVEGKQKAIFNWLFLLGFISTAFLFAFFFRELRDLRAFVEWEGGSIIALPFRMTYTLYFTLLMIILHIGLLLGLYELRRTVYINFRKARHFEFERTKNNQSLS